MKTATLTILIALFGLVTFLTGCSLLAGQQQATTEDGKPLYVNAAGEATTFAVDPETGIANTPLMEYAEDGGLLSTGARISKQVLPSPWGDIAAAVLGLGVPGVIAWAVKKNAESRKNRKLAVELVQSVEASPTAKAAIKKDAAAHHSPELKSFVASVTKPQATTG